MHFVTVKNKRNFYVDWDESHPAHLSCSMNAFLTFDKVIEYIIYHSALGRIISWNVRKGEYAVG